MPTKIFQHNLPHTITPPSKIIVFQYQGTSIFEHFFSFSLPTAYLPCNIFTRDSFIQSGDFHDRVSERGVYI